MFCYFFVCFCFCFFTKKLNQIQKKMRNVKFKKFFFFLSGQQWKAKESQIEFQNIYPQVKKKKSCLFHLFVRSTIHQTEVALKQVNISGSILFLYSPYMLFLSIHLALLPYKQPKFFCGRKSGLWKISFTLVETLILLNCYWQKHPIFFTIIFWFSKITEKIAFFFFNVYF